MRELALPVALALGLSCGSSHDAAPVSPSSPTPPAALAFTQSPIDPSNIGSITPLGNLNPPGHTIPTDHTYFYHPTQVVPVFAPAGGTVFEARRGSDDAIYVRATPGIFYYLAHLTLDPAIVSGTTIAAGQRLGSTSTLAQALDLGVSNDAVTLFFARPERYPTQTIHADSGLKYFQEPVRSALSALVNRSGADKDGKIDFDRPGALSGNWFLDGLAVADSMNVTNGPQHLAFVHDVQEPSRLRASIGGSLSMSGAFWIANGAPEFADVTPASGALAYRLFANATATSPVGVLVVEMIAGDRIRVETFTGNADGTPAFTEHSLVYTR
jgi:hypothetical protein